MMFQEKKRLIIIGAVLVLILVAIFFVFQKRQLAIVSPGGEPVITQEEEAKLVSYQDEAGFSFNYPENLKVKDITGDDQTLYSLLEMTNEKEEKMIIKVADSTHVSVETWLKSKEATGAGTSREVTLAEMPGKQIQFDKPRKLVTIIVSENVMYYFESPLDEKGVWNKIHNTIVSSFALSQAAVPASQGSQGGGDTIYEEEEVIE